MASPMSAVLPSRSAVWIDGLAASVSAAVTASPACC